MLKRLELVGFKSFADKTQFDFGSGITAIVGPNGSGKSNIVDAVRWILGEQSAVDVLLQSSTKERRTIFEEAAGISRFKAKKIETQRKLERVDLNLQRLRDIIDEVAKQLRSVKLQAAKAQRYQEYSGRLKELRLSLGLDKYQALTEKLDAETAVLEQLRGGLTEHAA